jgi:hypothetical protein
MKKNLSTLGAIICIMAVLASCDYEEQIMPTNDKIPKSAELKSDNSLIAAKNKKDNPTPLTAVTGTIDGRNFTGNLIVTEFIEDAGAVYAQTYLTDVKIKGKDHKYLEFILENETYLVPVTINDNAQAEAAGRLAQSCTILNLSFNGASVDLLGFAVEIDPVSVTIDGSDDEVLGNLICTVLDTLNNVVELVGLLNQILGLLTGLV